MLARSVVITAAVALMASLLVFAAPGASAGAAQAGGVSLSMEGEGAVAYYYRGAILDVFHSETRLALGARELTLTTELELIPDLTAALFPLPDPGYRFAGWSGSATGTATQTFPVPGDYTFHANFVPKPVVAAAAGDGNVTVETLDGTILCDTVTVCEADIGIGDQFVLTAVADPIADLSTFTGPCVPLGQHQCVGVAGAPIVTAHFTTPVSELTVTVSGASGGYIHVPGHGRCGSTCTYDLPERGPVVQLTESTHEAVFTGWSGACSGMERCSIDPALGDQRVVGNFQAIWDHS